LPVTRNPGEAVFSGSIIRLGEIGALVYATGQNTYFGKTAQLVQEAHTVSHRFWIEGCRVARQHDYDESEG
jgi:H+-transporting ATPase